MSQKKMKLSPGREKLVLKIIEDRELPPEVLQVLELMVSGELELNEEQYPELVKALLRSDDFGDGPHKIGGIIFR